MTASEQKQARQNTRRLRLAFLVIAILLALYFCYLLVAPFLQPILSAAVIAIVCYPLHDRVQSHLRHPNAAALVSLLLVAILVVVPILLLSQILVQEWKTAFPALSQQMERSGGWTPLLSHLLDKATRWVQRFLGFSQVDLRASVLSHLEQLGSSFFANLTGFFSNLTNFALQATLMFIALFFFLRDGSQMWQRMSDYLPLRKRQLQKLSDSVNATIFANVYGGLAGGLVQGALLSLSFYVLGLPAPLLWGVVTALCSLIPFLGSALIWLPASVILLLSGSWIKGLLLLGWGAGVVGMADNLIRPLIVSGSTSLHGLQTFIALLGGLQAFGLIGLFIGPVVMAVTQALFEILKEETQAWRATHHLADDTPRRPPRHSAHPLTHPSPEMSEHHVEHAA